MVIATMIHNPLSGFDWTTKRYESDHGWWETRNPIAKSDRYDHGYFDLGLRSVYISTLFGTTILVAMALFLAGDKRE